MSVVTEKCPYHVIEEKNSFCHRHNGKCARALAMLSASLMLSLSNHKDFSFELLPVGLAFLLLTYSLS
jgi:hypothetical protein